jgi:2-keto-3-deoxy-L-rhamnonate aldolase RhmA
MEKRMTFEGGLRRRPREGKRTAGAWLQIACPLTAEIMSQAGFDWLVIDMEHGPRDILTLIAQLQACKGTGIAALDRPPWNDSVVIKRILGTGVDGVLIPYVNSREEAEAAVSACTHPPAGIRGVAGSPRAQGYGEREREYLTQVDEELLIIVAVETPTAIANLDEILLVGRLDGIFVGPMDAATNMGHWGNPKHPEVRDAFATIENKVRGAGKALGTMSSDRNQAQDLYEKGYQLVTLMDDGVSLAKLATKAVAAFRKAYPQGRSRR